MICYKPCNRDSIHSMEMNCDLSSGPQVVTQFILRHFIKYLRQIVLNGRLYIKEAVVTYCTLLYWHFYGGHVKSMRLLCEDSG
jgi:hypothetical protein